MFFPMGFDSPSGQGGSRGLAMSLWAAVLLLAMLMLASACGGDSPGGAGGDREDPEATQPRETAGETAAQPTRPSGTAEATEEASGALSRLVGEATAKSGFASVSVAEFHSCGVRNDGAVVCWGPDYYGEATPPWGEFSSVSAGQEYTCGVRTDGAVLCWGDDHEGGRATPPEGEFSSVSAGHYHACGVRTDSSVACWGDDGNGKATPPEGEFASVSAGGGHTCGVRTDGSVACWGSNDKGQVHASGRASSPPSAPGATGTPAG